jgi:hypothetical protein
MLTKRRGALVIGSVPLAETVWKPVIAIALLNAPALVAELGVDLGPLRHAGPAERSHAYRGLFRSGGLLRRPR